MWLIQIEKKQAVADTIFQKYVEVCVCVGGGGALMNAKFLNQLRD